MQCQMAYIKGNNQLLVRNLTDDSTRIVDFSEINQQNLHVLFYEEQQLEDSSLKEALVEESKFYPMRDAKDLGLTLDKFEKLDQEQAKNIFSDINSNWVLQNNVTLLDDLFTVVDHLNALWPNDRTAFFEELWFILKNNLGATNTKFVYNDLKKTGKNEDKNTLIQVSIDGGRVPNPTEGGEFEKKLMESFKDEFSLTYNLSEYDSQKGQLVITSTIKQSPLVIMASVNSFTMLQSSILKTLITALNR